MLSKISRQHIAQHVNFNPLMLKTYLYLPEELNKKIIRSAKEKNKSKAEIIRLAIEKGINEIDDEEANLIDALFKLGELTKGVKFDGPKDSSTRIDELLWSKDWDKDE